jgi:hypothetical protein
MLPWLRSPEDALLILYASYYSPILFRSLLISDVALYTGIYGVCRSTAAIAFYAFIVSQPERQVCPFPTRLTQRSGGSHWTSNSLADLRHGMLPDTLVHRNLYNGGRYNRGHSFCLGQGRRYRRNCDGDALRNLYAPCPTFWFPPVRIS